MADANLYLFAYLFIGALAGTLAGLLGVGGGLVIVPALVAAFYHQNMPSDIIMHLALGTSLATIIITSLSSIRAHHQHQAILWPTVWRLTPTLMVGAWLGGWLASIMTTHLLKPIFGLFELLVAVYMLSGRQMDKHAEQPSIWLLNTAGGGIGAISAIVGIGGGTMTVPFLSWYGVALRKAIATSAACGLPIALAAALSYVINGWQHNHSVNNLGYVHLPAFIGIIITSVLFAPLGAMLTHRLPVPLIRKVFACLLIAVAIKLLFSEF